MDGRDIGTCVLPNANVKVYLTADPHVRALRRYEELKAKGQSPDLDTIEKDIIDRDYQDMHRELSPLRQAEDATLLDSSNMTIEEVADAIIALCR
jgi:cytidylate kinase